IRWDLTVEPGKSTFSLNRSLTGSMPNYSRAPRVPYLPHSEDFLKHGKLESRKICMIPLTSGSYRYGFGYFRTRARRILANGFRNRLQDIPLSMWAEWKEPNTFDRMLEFALTVQRRPYLAFAIRTNMGVDAATTGNVKTCFQALLSHPSRERFMFCTPGEALAILKSC
ncbi:MAG: hypothetical protein ACT4OO_09300, partial [Nitrospiraceae bacterium]